MENIICYEVTYKPEFGELISNQFLGGY